MKIRHLFISFFSTLLLFILIPTITHAEISNIPLESVNCFDYYKFGSVNVDISPTLDSIPAGVQMTFKGSIRNDNPYPIVNGAVYIKIFRKQDIKNDIKSNGHDLIDQFIALDNITLSASSSITFSFNWQSPAYARAGDYMVATYFVSSDKFNLLGLTFTDDITGNTRDFKITSTENSSIYFDKNKVTVNNETYRFAAFAPKVKASDPVSVKSILLNTTNKTLIIPVTYKLYSWDAMHKNNLITSETEDIIIKAGQSATLSSTITDNRFPVYFLVIEAKYNDVKSILDIRFVREGIERPRLNFPSITNYPITNDSKIFACMHNSGLANKIEDGRLELYLFDGDRLSDNSIDSEAKVLSFGSYTGPITGNMMGLAVSLKNSIPPGKKILKATLVANLYWNDSLIESSAIIYSCEKLDPILCPVLSSSESSSNTKDLSFYILLVVTFIAIVIIILLIRSSTSEDKKHILFGLVFTLIISSGMWYDIINSSKVLAIGIDPNATTQITPTISGVLTDVQLIIVNGKKFMSKDINPDAIKPGVCVRNADNTLTCGKDAEGYFDISSLGLQRAYGINVYVNGISQKDGNVKVGDIIKISQVPNSNTSSSWYITGNTIDTPYGYWGEGDPTVSCSESDSVGTNTIYHPSATAWKAYTYYYYLPVMFRSPSFNVSSKSNNLIPTGIVNEWRVTKTGAVSLQAKFEKTKAEAFLQYKAIPSGTSFSIGKNIYSCFKYSNSGNGTTIKADDIRGVEIPINFTAVEPVENNKIPTTPIITFTPPNPTCLPVSGGTVPMTFTVTSSDPEGKSITITIKDNDVVIGTGSSPLIVPRNYSLIGQHTITATAVDDQGAVSLVGTNSFTITNCAVLPPTCSITSISPNSIVKDTVTPVTISWTATDANSCVSTGGFTVPSPTSPRTENIKDATTFSLTCTGNTAPPAICSATVTTTPPEVPQTLKFYLKAFSNDSQKKTLEVRRFGNAFIGLEQTGFDSCNAISSGDDWKELFPTKNSSEIGNIIDEMYTTSGKLFQIDTSNIGNYPVQIQCKKVGKSNVNDQVTLIVTPITIKEK